MIGILVQLLLSAILAWIFDKRKLFFKGFLPTAQHLIDLSGFFLLTAFFCAGGFLLKMFFGNQQWVLNPNLSFQLVMAGTWWNIKSVLFEELLFRGILLYILIQKAGETKAILLSAIAFGIYHWFSFGVLGNPVQMIIVFLMTGTMGLVLAYGYTKTLSLYLPTGIHLGWNLTQIFVFSQGPIGDGLLIPAGSREFRTDSYLIFIVVTFLPILLVLLTNYFLIRQRANKQLSEHIEGK